MKLKQVMLMAAISCVMISAALSAQGAESTAKSRVWKVSDVAGLIAAVNEVPLKAG